MAEHRLVKLASRFTVTDGRSFRLGDFDPPSRVPYTAANDPNSRCVVKGTGCVVVFGHSGR